MSNADPPKNQPLRGSSRVRAGVSRPRSVYANRVDVAWSQEAVALSFGSILPLAPDGESHPELTRRLILSPTLAKGLSRRLNAALRQISGFPMDPGPSRREADPDRVREMVAALGVHTGYEDSFKLLRQTILEDRFLFAFVRPDESRDPAILRTCQVLGMPPHACELFQTGIPQANVILLGYEHGPSGGLYKAYLEFGSNLVGAGPGGEESALLHMGVKWTPAKPGHYILTRYEAFPRYTVDDMLERLREAHFGPEHETYRAVIESIAMKAVECRDREAFLYVEARESETGRCSFDLNLYRANLKMTDIAPELTALFEIFQVPQSHLARRLEKSGDQIFGHVSGGIDRTNRPFVTIYHGELGSTF